MDLDNYVEAKKEADRIDEKIIAVLQSGKSFRVEAGAGSGKTYSLNRVVDWIQDNKERELTSKKQKVACITYTNAAVNVITERLKGDSSIIPSTIHSFMWENIHPFQSVLIRLVSELQLLPSNSGHELINSVSYTLGIRYIEEGVLYLYHDDVIKIFAKLMNNKKFRRLLALKYPIILIDEYQDSFRVIIDQFIKWFIEPQEGPQFGFFGDSWQTIYASNGACGIIEHANIEEIKKKSNFRSQQIIVDILNKIRPELPQISAVNEKDGKVFVVTNDDYTGIRQGGYYKDELPEDILKERIDLVLKRLHEKYEWNESSKTLMITHKMLAKQQGYQNLLRILDDDLKNDDDPFLNFFEATIEPVFQALNTNDTKELFEILSIQRMPITQKKQKKMWLLFRENLGASRKGTIGDVMACVIDSKLIKIPPKLQEFHYAYCNNADVKYAKENLKNLYDIEYSEVLSAIEFLGSNGKYSTDHGVKGEEYDNILFVVGRGWNNYKFDDFIYKDPCDLCAKDYDAYVRNRNLFYVCCSRSRKNLVLFITVPAVKKEFVEYLERVFGKENIYNYGEFMSE